MSERRLLDRPVFKPFALALAACAVVCACAPAEPPPPAKLSTTYRVLAGISMGAIGTAAQGPRHPERFDALAVLGGPLDASLLLRTMDSFQLGGFCPREELERLAAANPASLNDPEALAACSRRPATLQWEHSQDFNHWVYTTNGGFDRDQYAKVFSDLSLAYGNLLYENPTSPYAPPGVPVEALRNPAPDFCAHPVRVKGLRNAEYNPDGRHDAITFCDGESPLYYCRADRLPVDFCAVAAHRVTPLTSEQADAFATSTCAGRGGAAIANPDDDALLMLQHGGRFDACRLPTRPLLVALALDINGNGRRDYGEPLLNNGQERFDDVGTDGCADALEDGKGGCGGNAAGAADPNGDNYDAERGPLGTEANWKWDVGEPYRDDGLDGVPGTGDTGEGNGAFDLCTGRRRLYELDLRTRLRTLSPEALARLNYLSDGGIRDVLNFGLATRQVQGLLRTLLPGTTGEYRDFLEIPGMVDVGGGYRGWGGKWTRAPANVSILYGKEKPTDQDRVDGDGDHVGTNTQASNRVATLFSWVGARWPSLPKPEAPFVGEPYESRVSTRQFDSKVLGAKRDYTLFLPPGYDLPQNASVRYPVMFMLHGYGHTSESLTTTTFLADAFMKDSAVRLRPMIVVLPSGTCCFVQQGTGARDCREHDDAGRQLAALAGWRRECGQGSFFVNHSGSGAADDSRYGDSLFELMDVVDAELRTLPPAEVDAR